jgi:hypothetical protein
MLTFCKSPKWNGIQCRMVAAEENDREGLKVSGSLKNRNTA